jgi:flagellar biogenesis protein FliO
MGLVLLVGAMILLAMCLQLGVGKAASSPAGAGAEAASGVATTQPAPLGPAASGPASAHGAKTPATPPGWKGFAQQTRQFGDSGAPSPLWQMLGMVVVIAVFGIGGLWVVKRLVPKIQQRRGRNIAVLETACLGPSRNVHLLRVGDKEFLVASTRERISMLAEVTGAIRTPADELGTRGVEL